jgi:hypothetical protein
VLRRVKEMWNLRYYENGRDVVRLRWHGRILAPTDTPGSVSDFYSGGVALAGGGFMHWIRAD